MSLSKRTACDAKQASCFMANLRKATRHELPAAVIVEREQAKKIYYSVKKKSSFSEYI